MEKEIEGIVLRQVPYKEKDKIVTIITREGLLSFNARGIASLTSKNSSSCNLFSLSNFTLNEKGNYLSLKQGKLIDSHYELYESLESMSAIQLAFESLIRFMDENDNKIYDYVLSFFDNLKKGFDSMTLIVILLAQLIKSSGYALEYSSCVECGNKNNIVQVNYRVGGFLCYECAKKYNEIHDDKDYLKSFRYVFMVSYDMMNHYELDRKIASRLLKEFIDFLNFNFDNREIKAYEIYKNSIIM